MIKLHLISSKQARAKLHTSYNHSEVTITQTEIQEEEEPEGKEKRKGNLHQVTHAGNFLSGNDASLFLYVAYLFASMFLGLCHRGLGFFLGLWF